MSTSCIHCFRRQWNGNSKKWEIVGLRNILTHRYYAVDDAQIWTTIRDKLPPVPEAVGKLIPPLPPEVEEE
ncbi:MAG: Ribonuclease HepT-like [Thermoanaerobaculia bacterium]|jgi:uncharacterized protein with HEPN domain|nr:Ribonuclease HepT-like [Thermoanaerobaculia bacterium]